MNLEGLEDYLNSKNGSPLVDLHGWLSYSDLGYEKNLALMAKQADMRKIQ